MDDAVQSTESTNMHSDSVPMEAGKPYSDAAKRRSQLKTTDLIPKRPIPLAIVLTVVIAMAVMLNLLSYGLGQWQTLSESARRVFSFSGVGTLPNWFSSMLLVTTGMASLQIYGMRRHRCDDYNGHYQIWLFLAVLFSLASVNCVVDFTAVFSSLAQMTGFNGGMGFVIFLVAKMIALTALVIRGILEIRASRAALAAVVVVWVAYSCAVVVQIPGVQEQLVQNDKVVVGNLALVGNIAVFFAAVFYSRFVYLHANELIELQSADPASMEGEVGRSNAKKSPVTEDDQSEEQILNLQQQSKATRSNRKRSKKMQKQQRRAA